MSEMLRGAGAEQLGPRLAGVRGAEEPAAVALEVADLRGHEVDVVDEERG